MKSTLPGGLVQRYKGKTYTEENFYNADAGRDRAARILARLQHCKGMKSRTVKTEMEARVLTDMGWRIQVYGPEYIVLSLRA